MKKKYDAPELELLRLRLTADVLTVSDPEGSHTSAGSLDGPGEGNSSGLIDGDF